MARTLFSESGQDAQTPAVAIFDVEPERFCLAYYRNVSFILWNTQADGAALQRLALLNQHLIKVYPQGHSNFTFVRPGVEMPDEEARAAMAELFDGSKQLRASSVICEGEGFWASALRSTLTQVHHRTHYAQSRTEVRLNTSIAEAAEWLAAAHSDATGLTVKPLQLERLAAGARADMQRALTSAGF